MKDFYQKPIIALMTALLCICSALLFTGYTDPEPDRSHAPYEADFELLWDELTDSYPYLPYLREQGTDTDSICERYSAELASVDGEAEFAYMLQRMFSELGNFAHLSLVTPELYRNYCYIYAADDDPEAEHSPGVFRSILQDPRLSARYRAPERPGEARDTETENRYPKAAVHYYDDCKALYLQIPSFAQETVRRDRYVICDALKKYPETEHIIFDITGNSGGSDQYWMENLVAPFGGRYEFRFRNFFRKSGIYDEYYPDLETRPVTGLEDAPAWAERMGLDRYYESTLVLPEEGSVPLPLNRDIRRWVLTGSRVYSASEKFACFCKATGWATLVGRRTSGDGLGATPVLILLPDSGLLVRFSYFAGENPDGSLNAAAGTRPDVICVKNTLPLTRCLELIRNGY